MKVFWWNGGVQVQPESDVEMEAMLILLHAVTYERPPEVDGQRKPPDVSRNGQVERGSDFDV